MGPEICESRHLITTYRNQQAGPGETVGDHAAGPLVTPPGHELVQPTGFEQVPVGRLPGVGVHAADRRGVGDRRVAQHDRSFDPHREDSRVATTRTPYVATPAVSNGCNWSIFL